MSARQDEQGTGAGADWSHEHRFEVLVSVPEVKAAIERCAAQARVPMSAEEFLAKATMVLPNGAAIRRGGARGRALALRWGLQTGKSQDTEINAPVGRVIACVLCSMVYHAQVVRSVEQREDGCTLIAEIPSDVKTYGGVLQVSIGRGRPGSTTVPSVARTRLIGSPSHSADMPAAVRSLASSAIPCPPMNWPPSAAKIPMPGCPSASKRHMPS